MSDRQEEDRSWTDGLDGDQAVESMRSGITRLRSQVADFRQQMSETGGASNDDDVVG